MIRIFHHLTERWAYMCKAEIFTSGNAFSPDFLSLLAHQINIIYVGSTREHRLVINSPFCWCRKTWGCTELSQLCLLTSVKDCGSKSGVHPPRIFNPDSLWFPNYHRLPTQLPSLPSPMYFSPIAWSVPTNQGFFSTVNYSIREIVC